MCERRSPAAPAPTMPTLVRTTVSSRALARPSNDHVGGAIHGPCYIPRIVWIRPRPGGLWSHPRTRTRVRQLAKVRRGRMSTACGASYRHGRYHLALNFLGSHSVNCSRTELLLVEDLALDYGLA